MKEHTQAAAHELPDQHRLAAHPTRTDASTVHREPHLSSLRAFNGLAIQPLLSVKHLELLQTSTDSCCTQSLYPSYRLLQGSLVHSTIVDGAMRGPAPANIQREAWALLSDKHERPTEQRDEGLLGVPGELRSALRECLRDRGDSLRWPLRDRASDPRGHRFMCCGGSERCSAAAFRGRGGTCGKLRALSLDPSGRPHPADSIGVVKAGDRTPTLAVSRRIEVVHYRRRRRLGSALEKVAVVGGGRHFGRVHYACKLFVFDL